MDKQAAFHAHLENINTLKEKKSVQIVRWDVRRTLSVTIKVNVCCVPSVKRLHEMVVQSVKIVVLASMVMVAKNAKQANIACLPRTILRLVSNVVLGDTNRILAKQAAFHVHQEGANTLKEKKIVQTVKLDVRRIA